MIHDGVCWNMVIWGHIDILVVAVRSLSRSEQVKTLLAGPSPISPMKADLPYFQHSPMGIIANQSHILNI